MTSRSYKKRGKGKPRMPKAKTSHERGLAYYQEWAMIYFFEKALRKTRTKWGRFLANEIATTSPTGSVYRMMVLVEYSVCDKLHRYPIRFEIISGPSPRGFDDELAEYRLARYEKDRKSWSRLDKNKLAQKEATRIIAVIKEFMDAKPNTMTIPGWLQILTLVIYIRDHFYKRLPGRFTTKEAHDEIKRYGYKTITIDMIRPALKIINKLLPKHRCPSRI